MSEIVDLQPGSKGVITESIISDESQVCILSTGQQSAYFLVD